jgi:hypothetical protein
MFHRTVQIAGGVGMVVVQVDVQAGVVQALAEIADAGGLAGVHHDEPSDLLLGDVFQPLEGVVVLHRLGEEVPEVFFLRAGKGEHRLGVELVRGDHGGQPVEIGVYMGGDDFHSW